jgi:hypothetical protein
MEQQEFFVLYRVLSRQWLRRLVEILRPVAEQGGAPCCGFARSRPPSNESYRTGSPTMIYHWRGAGLVRSRARPRHGCCHGVLPPDCAPGGVHTFLDAGLVGLLGGAAAP